MTSPAVWNSLTDSSRLEVKLYWSLCGQFPFMKFGQWTKRGLLYTNSPKQSTAGDADGTSR